MKKLSALFITIGASLLFVSAFLIFKQQDFLANALTSEGQVIQLVQTRSGTYSPIVQFESHRGEIHEITSTSSSKPPAYDVGEKVIVYYESYDPEGGEISGFFSLWGVPTILGGIGSGFILIGTVFLIILSDKSRLLKKLKVSGVRVQAQVESIQLNHSIVFNGQHPYRVFAKWNDPHSGEEITFVSVNLWSDPSDQLTSEYVTVFMDKDNPKKYVMDLAAAVNCSDNKEQLA